MDAGVSSNPPGVPRWWPSIHTPLGSRAIATSGSKRDLLLSHLWERLGEGGAGVRHSPSVGPVSAPHGRVDPLAASRRVGFTAGALNDPADLVKFCGDFFIPESQHLQSLVAKVSVAAGVALRVLGVDAAVELDHDRGL